jgi:uncharacterized membrane protein
MTDDTPSPIGANSSVPEITSDDKLLGAVSYFAIVAIILLLLEDKRSRPFIKYHAVQSIALSIILFVITVILGWIPIVNCFVPLIWLVLLWPAIDAFQGHYTVIPVVSDFLRRQGLVS